MKSVTIIYLNKMRSFIWLYLHLYRQNAVSGNDEIVEES